MNKTTTALSLLLGTLIVASPVAAFAETSGYGSVDASVSATTSVKASEDLRDSVEDRIRNRKADLLERATKERERMEEKLLFNRNGTSTDERRASSTRPLKERAENSGRGPGIEKRQEHAGDKIDERIEKMQKQIERVAQMERLSDAQKASITAELNTQITALTTLKTSIGSETDAAKVKELTQSIGKAYRVYAVTMPKAAITAASDRIMKVVAQMESFTVKLEARVTASGSAEASTAFTDYKLKVADAKVQAQAAATLVASLSADNGDATVAASNTAALKSAKEKIDAAQKDLKDARKDIGVILKAVRGTGDDSAS